jgi:hypothetical protein
MAPILARTPLAAITFISSGKKNIRVYYQDYEGYIRETFYQDGVGWQLRDKDVVGQGKLNTGIAVTWWADGTQIRVYYLDTSNKIVERCYTGGAAGSWFDGELTGQFTAAHYSQLAATSYIYQSSQYIRVYYQATDNSIKEVVRIGDTPWKATGLANIGTAIAGSSINADSLVETLPGYVWVYYQTPGTDFVEWLWENGNAWIKSGIFKSNSIYPPGAGITSCSFPKNSHRVFTISQDNQLGVTSYDHGGNWSKTEFIAYSISFSSVAAIALEDGKQISVYFQNEGSKITEYLSTDGGKKWSLGKDVLPTKA